jgi:phosphatidylserine decarboxylase
MVRPYSKNKRVVTIIDTDVEGGTGIGLVAMIEVVALMIGDIVQC